MGEQILLATSISDSGGNQGAACGEASGHGTIIEFGLRRPTAPRRDERTRAALSEEPMQLRM